MIAPTLNTDGVNVAALTCAIELWLESDPDRTAAQLSAHSGVHQRGIWQIRASQRPACSLDWADRLTLAMDVDLETVAPATEAGDAIEPVRVRRPGKPVGKHVKHITPEDLRLAHDLHWRGVPLRRIARYWHASGRITYATEQAAVSSVYSLFEVRGWPRRDRIEMVRRVSTTHGRAGRTQARAYGPDYAAYRRQQRKRAGYLQDRRCAARNKDGAPCRRWALTGRSHCVAHDPARHAERQRIMELAWAASRARMLRWGDHKADVERTIAAHGQAALAATAGMSSTVIGRMRRYDDEQPFKPETWAKIARGIAALRSSGVP